MYFMCVLFMKALFLGVILFYTIVTILLVMIITLVKTMYVFSFIESDGCAIVSVIKCSFKCNFTYF